MVCFAHAPDRDTIPSVVSRTTHMTGVLGHVISVQDCWTRVLVHGPLQRIRLAVLWLPGTTETIRNSCTGECDGNKQDDDNDKDACTSRNNKRLPNRQETVNTVEIHILHERWAMKCGSGSHVCDFARVCIRLRYHAMPV